MSHIVSIANITTPSERFTGLTDAEAKLLLAKHGANRLAPVRTITFWNVAASEIREPLILLLLLVALAYSLLGNLEDVIAIILVIVSVVAVEVRTEFKARKAIFDLRHYAPAQAVVVRSGKPHQIDVAEVVPGDMLLLTAGTRVSADARLLEAHGLATDESHLTGESTAQDKHANEQGDMGMVYAGSAIVLGRGVGKVTATGVKTRMGQVAGLVAETKEPKTPLQLTMKRLAGQLIWVSLFLSALVTLLGVLWGRDWEHMVLTGLTVAFATLPEELPVLITMVLAIGAHNLAHRQALVKKLYAAETMGSVTVVASDKTGTLTWGRLSISSYVDELGKVSTDPDIQTSLIRVGVCSSDVSVSPQSCPEDLIGDQIQLAFYNEAWARGESPAEMRAEAGELVREFAFDGSRRTLARLYANSEGATLYVCGAPEAILGEAILEEAQARAVMQAAELMAGQGLRVIGLGIRHFSAVAPPPQRSQLECELAFVGLVGLLDQARAEAAPAVAELKQAGVRTMMVTGDHPLTAATVAQKVGITGSTVTGSEVDNLSAAQLTTIVQQAGVFARTSPEHKLRIVRALQAGGEVVAVTGDGINDAPAFRAANVGIAMGLRGTDLAREAAGVVLLDDNFTTIVAALAEGRRLFANLEKAIAFYLAYKLALVAVVTLPTLLGAPPPFQPLQIVIMEMAMDLASVAAFVAQPAEPDLMRRAPRPAGQPFLRPLLPRIIFGGLALALASGIPFAISLLTTGEELRAGTLAFTTWIPGTSLLALSMSSPRQSVIGRGPGTNRIFILWFVLAVIGAMLSVYIPLLNRTLFTLPITAGDWLTVGLALIALIVCTELGKLLTRR